MDQAWLPYWTGSPDENPSFICLCVLPSFCLLMAFSLNIIALFLGCPGSRYCPTKYFMEQSTRYLPAISYSLSKIKGSSFGRGKREEVYSVVFIFKVSHMQQKHKGPGSLRGVGEDKDGHLFIYLPVYLQLIQPRNVLALDSQHCFLEGPFPICSEGKSSKRLCRRREKLAAY